MSRIGCFDCIDGQTNNCDGCNLYNVSNHLNDALNAMNIVDNIDNINALNMAKVIVCADCDIDFCKKWRLGIACQEVKKIVKIIEMIIKILKGDHCKV